MKNALPDLAGKIVSLALIGEESSRVIVDPRFETQGERLFIIGRIPPGSSKQDWLAGLEGAVAWDQVQEYVVFASPDDYRDRLQVLNKRKRSRKK